MHHLETWRFGIFENNARRRIEYDVEHEYEYEYENMYEQVKEINDRFFLALKSKSQACHALCLL